MSASDDFDNLAEKATCLTLWTLKPDISGFVHSLHCNHQMAAQNESMPVPVGDGCSQYIYRHFAAIFTKFDRGKVFLRLF